jgi:starvation-inducible DNA-binding protein
MYYVRKLKQFLASQYAFMAKCHFFHWNVEGTDFKQLHDFFQELYEDMFNNAIDQTAEHIRMLDGYAPGSLERFLELSRIDGQIEIPRSRIMLEKTRDDLDILIELAKEIVSFAPEQENSDPSSGFVSGRIDVMMKYRWMIQSMLKENRT